MVQRQGLEYDRWFTKGVKSFNRYILHFWDVGGQKNLRCYWRNYFERTDGVIWVVDSTDRQRMLFCRDELARLLNEEVQYFL